MNKEYQVITSYVIFFLLGVAGGFLLYQFVTVGSNLLCDKEKFHYINLELVCTSKPVVKKSGYAELKSRLESLIEEKKEAHELTTASIYFRDLQNGPTWGINEYHKFAPASLLKVPILITYLELSEEDPSLLERRLKYRIVGPESMQAFPPEFTINEDDSYTVKELLGYMIKYSDNRANNVLSQYLVQLFPGRDILKQTFVDLGVIEPTSELEETLSVKSYTSVFIQLYHASFFKNKETSEEALALLTETTFNDGLASRLPAGVEVAHKFGERGDAETGMKQLHDCGIVYYPKNPYLICIMTRGYDFHKLAEIIGEISEAVYAEFDSRKI